MSVRRLSNSFISTEGRGKSSTLLAGYVPGVDEMDLIERVVVGSGGISAIEFINIPQTYQHLQIRAVSRLGAGSDTGVANHKFRLNDISTSTYAWHQLYGNGSSALANGGANQNGIESVFRSMGYNTAANIFAPNILNILDYTNTSKNTVVTSTNGGDLNGSGILLLSSGLFVNTSAITKISITHPSIVGQYSTISLYGVKI